MPRLGPVRSFLWVLLFTLPSSLSAVEPVSFSREVLPILSDRCFHCHGPDESHREAGLRLDLREAAVEDLGGFAAIVPEDPDESELMMRVASDDPDLRMPPADAHRKPLSQAEIETLRRWIDEGAPWGRHWSFEPPVRGEIPIADLHPIDAFVRVKLEQAGLQPAPAAKAHTLLRRASFDLTGLPPTVPELEAFTAADSTDTDKTSGDYEAAVDRLLESPHYGERMAMWWLDAARYSDTDGYQQDANRSNWPWRDWVVQAFHDNMPFEQFTIEQFAGDLLPNATPEQILATCFHRNHMTNGEGGRDPEESRIDYVIDRVNTTGTVWLGLTLGCAQCHSHKFDPVSQSDYYSLFAFFDSIDEDGKAGRNAKPYLKIPSPFAERAIGEAQQVVDARRRIADAVRDDAEQAFHAWLADRVREVEEGFDPWHPMQATSLHAIEGTVLTQEPDAIVQASGPNPRQEDYRLVASLPETLQRRFAKHGPPTDAGPTEPRITGFRLEVFPHASHTDGKLSRGAQGEFVLTNVKLQIRQRGRSQLRDIDIAAAVADVERQAKGRDYGQVGDTLDDDPRNGWTTQSHDATIPHVAVFSLAEPVHLADDDELILVLFHRSTVGDANIGRFRLSVTDQPGDAVRTLAPMPLEQLASVGGIDPDAMDGKLRTRLHEQFLADHSDYVQAKQHLERAERQLAEVKRASGEQSVMVLAEREDPRQTFVLNRGAWDQKGEPVERSVPAAILPWPAEQTGSRLELAHWLVDRENPLTARVVVNQLWQLCFGAGLVRTPDDFGLQGESPTHPELLDWLAVELMESGWDLKHLLRLIVTSETYKQSSDVTPELLELDPDNRLLARGARFRLPSWMIRDAALRSSGLLNAAIGGPPVMPYQPPGVWSEMFMGRFQYEASQGPPQHRRTLYAFWRRSAAPTFLFDSAQRRVCEVNTRLTNTPLHALTLMNDLNILEASRELAKAAVSPSRTVSADATPLLERHSSTPRPAGRDQAERLRFMFRSIVSRDPSDSELSVLSREYERAVSFYECEPGAAGELLTFGQPEYHATEGDTAQVAAHLLVASMIFNLDEAINHE